MKLERSSPCKVNLLLNILCKRQDGFHELETLMQPVALYDHLAIELGPHTGIQLTCSDPLLATDASNLVHKAAAKFFQAIGREPAVRIHLEKRIPMAAGLGGGSGNAATTLLLLNELFDAPLELSKLSEIAASLGSDIPFFLYQSPALATGRGEHIMPLDSFNALKGSSLLLIHPGFGISTAWAYQKLAEFPKALNGERGRAERLIQLLQASDLDVAGRSFYNSLEAPAFHKFPILEIYQEFLRSEGASAALMSGSGSTTFALFKVESTAQTALERFKAKFGTECWASIVPVN